MSWRYGEIEQEWLAGGVLALRPEQVEAAFRCEEVLGREWIDQSRGTSSGAVPTLHVTAMGQRLAALDGIEPVGPLIDKIRKGDPSAAAELHAIQLLRSAGLTAVELFPRITVGSRVLNSVDQD